MLISLEAILENVSPGLKFVELMLRFMWFAIKIICIRKKCSSLLSKSPFVALYNGPICVKIQLQFYFCSKLQSLSDYLIYLRVKKELRSLLLFGCDMEGLTKLCIILSIRCKEKLIKLIRLLRKIAYSHRSCHSERISMKMKHLLITKAMPLFSIMHIFFSVWLFNDI